MKGSMKEAINTYSNGDKVIRTSNPIRIRFSSRTLRSNFVNVIILFSSLYKAASSLFTLFAIMFTANSKMTLMTVLNNPTAVEYP